MITTGVSGLDALLEKGIPRGSRVLYSLEPGVDGQIFMISSLACSVKQGLSCLVIMPSTTVDAFKNDATAMCGSHLDLGKISRQVVFIDAIDRERIQKSARTKKSQAQEWKARIMRICTEKKVDIIFAYLDLLNEDFGLKTALDILDCGRADARSTLFVEHLNLEGPQFLDRFTREFPFDLVLNIRSSDRPVPYFTYFTLVHSAQKTVPRSVPFLIRNNRIIPYNPRILITGPEHSGKSTFVATATEGPRPVGVSEIDREPVPEDMDYGWMQWRDFTLALYGIPGHIPSDRLIPPTLEHIIGIVLVIDAADPETFPQARQFIGMIEKKKIPFIIAANKNDLAGKLAPATIRRELALKKKIPICPISATKKPDVHAVIDALVDYITQYSA
ncbi:MAG: GTP-binding protein [Methanomicrobiales archaeon]|nr:GTP-binding protein [Methanomicrobiales archaeon]